MTFYFTPWFGCRGHRGGNKELCFPAKLLPHAGCPLGLRLTNRAQEPGQHVSLRVRRVFRSGLLSGRFRKLVPTNWLSNFHSPSRAPTPVLRSSVLLHSSPLPPPRPPA